MNLKTLYRLFLAIVFLTIFVSLSRYIGTVFTPSFDAADICSFVIDGDTFDIKSGYRVRLADVDTPEFDEVGYEEASSFLSGWILGESVYLDIDDIYVYDTTGSRLVCVVFVEVESGRYLNLNKALLDEGLAEIWDHDNEFNPYTWRRFVYDLTYNQKMIIVGFSFITSLMTVYVVNRAKRSSQRLLRRVSERKKVLDIKNQ